MQIRKLIVTFICGAMASGMASGKTIRVPQDAPTIQEGIDRANDFDAVLIAPGTYSGQKNINLDFHGKKMTVYGQRGPANCIIDCQQQGRGFVFHSGETPKSVLRNVTIQNGNAVDLGTVGGAIACINSSPTIDNCIIKGNQAGYMDASDPLGGGIYCDHSSPLIANCLIMENYGWKDLQYIVSFGGGIACVNESAPRIENCTISDNNMDPLFIWSSSGAGGGIYCEYSNPRIVGCTIHNNRAEGGGGIYAHNSAPIIENSEIFNNRADEYADPVWYAGGGVFFDGSAGRITGCYIHDNYANPAGGGIDCDGSSPEISFCNISKNRSSMFGGGLELSYSDATVWSCTFTENLSERQGGGIHTISDASRISGCMIATNWAIHGWKGQGGGICITGGRGQNELNACEITGNYSDGVGGGMFVRDDAMITNCVIGFNYAEQDGGGVECWQDEADDYRPIFSDCLINSNTAWTGGGGGVECAATTHPTFRNCSVASNNAVYGGGVQCANNSGPIFISCSVDHNTARGSGGGLHCEYASHPLISGCVIQQNKVTGQPEQDPDNGAYYMRQRGCGGGLSFDNSAAQIVDSVILDNHAKVGGGAYCYYGTDANGQPEQVYAPTFRNCTIRWNRATMLGGALYCWKGVAPALDSPYQNVPEKLQLLNTIIWDNGDNGNYPVIGVTKRRPLFQIEYCDLHGGVPAIKLMDGATVDAIANLSQNPLFTEDYHIADRSPCMDRGNSTWVLRDEADIDGEPRIMGARVDIGADEVWRLLIGKPPTTRVSPKLTIPRQFPEWLVDIWQDLLKKPHPKPEPPPPAYGILPVNLAVKLASSGSALEMAPKIQSSPLVVEQVQASLRISDGKFPRSVNIINE